MLIKAKQKRRGIILQYCIGQILNDKRLRMFLEDFTIYVRKHENKKGKQFSINAKSWLQNILKVIFFGYW